MKLSFFIFDVHCANFHVKFNNKDMSLKVNLLSLSVILNIFYAITFVILSVWEDNFQIERQLFTQKLFDAKFSNKDISLKVKFTFLSKLSIIFYIR